MGIGSYQLDGVDSNLDEWEFLSSLIYIRPTKNLNVLEIGEGNCGLIFAVCSELKRHLKMLYSVDVLNRTEIGESHFYQKKKTFTTLYNRGCDEIDAVEVDPLDEKEISTVKDFYGENKINILIINFLNSNQYMDDIFDAYNDLLNSETKVYFHELKKNEHSEKYFDKISQNKKNVKLFNSSGVGIITGE
jgi:hypothetical protein